MAFFVVGTGLFLISRQFPAPEASHSLLFALPAFGQFVLFVVSLISVGRFWLGFFRVPEFSALEDLFLSLVIGSGVAYGFAHLLSAMGLFSSRFALVLWALLAVGFSLRSRRNLSWNKKESVLLAVPLLLIVLKLIEGLQLHTHGDAYITYLAAPRAWASSGGFELFRTYTQFFLATSWETLSAWGTALMGLQSGNGLEASQWFSQWVTGGIGVFGLSLGLGSLCQRLAKDIGRMPPAIILSCLIVVAIQVPCLRWTANLAKNDMGACFLGFSAFYLTVFHAQHSLRLSMLAGLVAGTAGIAKLSLAPLALVLSASLLFTQCARGKLGHVVFICVGGVLGATPILVRNFILTSNPVFPWLSSWFDASGMPALGISEGAGSAHATTLSLNWRSMTVYLKEFFREVPLLWILPAMWIPGLRRPMLKPVLITCAIALLFTLTLRPSTEIRYQGPALVILGFLSVFTALVLLEKWLPKASPWLSAALAVALLANSNLTIFTLFQLKSDKFGTFSKRAEALADTGGPAKLWIRRNLKPTDQILVVGDGYPYYLLDYAMTQYSRVDGLERLISEGRTVEAAAALRATPFRYLYFGARADFVPYQTAIQEVMRIALSWSSACARYRTEEAQVWDLDCLRRL